MLVLVFNVTPSKDVRITAGSLLVLATYTTSRTVGADVVQRHGFIQ